MGQEVRDQVLLRVDVMLRALPESPVVEAEPAVLRAEFAGAVAAAVPVQAVGEAVAVQDLHGVRGEEPRARPGPDLGAEARSRMTQSIPAAWSRMPSTSPAGPAPRTTTSADSHNVWVV